MLLLLLAVGSVLVAGSNACSCARRPIQTVVCSARRLIKARIEGELDNGVDFNDWRNQDQSRQYKVTVLNVFKGDGRLEKDASIVIETAANGALCGITLAQDSTMLLEIDYYRGNYQISMCDLSRNWDYELDDELMADLVQDTLDCECQPKSRYGRSPCCNDNQQIWSVKMCTDMFGNCQNNDGQCQWHGSYDYDRCLNDFGFRLGKNSCVEKKPCPKFATERYSRYEQMTCEDSGVRELAWEKKICKCPEDRPILDVSKDSCVSEFDCPRGARVEEETGFTKPPKGAKDKKDEGDVTATPGYELDNIEIMQPEAKIECPANQIFYGENECLPCLQTCGSQMAWCTRICITNECGCPRDKPVLILDSCYTQEECANVAHDEKAEKPPCKDDEEEEEKEEEKEATETPDVFPTMTTDSCGPDGNCFNTETKPPTTQPTEDLTSGPASTEGTTDPLETDITDKTEQLTTESEDDKTPSEMPTTESEGKESTEPTSGESTTESCVGLACLPSTEQKEPTTEPMSSELPTSEDPTEPKSTEPSSEDGATTSGTPYPTSPQTVYTDSKGMQSSTEPTVSEVPTTDTCIGLACLPTEEVQETTKPISSEPTDASDETSEPITTEASEGTEITGEATTESSESEEPMTEEPTESYTYPTSPPTEFTESPGIESTEPTVGESTTESCVGLACLPSTEQKEPTTEPMSSELPTSEDPTEPKSTEPSSEDGATTSGTPYPTSPQTEYTDSKGMQTTEMTEAPSETSEPVTTEDLGVDNIEEEKFTTEPGQAVMEKTSEGPKSTEPLTSEQTETQLPETSEQMSSEPTEISTEQMTSEVTEEPTEQMSSEPTEEPETSEPMSSEPTDVSTEQMTSEVTDEPTEQISSEPTEEPETSEPMSSEPTDVSTEQMTSEVTEEPTEQSEGQKSTEPLTSEQTETLLPETSEQMSSEPTEISTEQMTSEVTEEPTEQMSSEPTEEPETSEPMSSEPTDVSTEQMTSEVTDEPTEQMSSEPTEEPETSEPMSSEPTDVSTEQMTSEVTDEPTEQMSSEPTEEPETSEPMSSEPTDVSTEQMTSEVTEEPTEQMSSEPTEQSEGPKSTEPLTSEQTETLLPETSEQMSSEPTEEPKTSEPMSSEPTDVSTEKMSSEPTDVSTEQMTSEVTDEPTEPMSSEPTDVSTEQMTSEVTEEPTEQMSSEPTEEPKTSEPMSSEPTDVSTEKMSSEPTDVSTEQMTSELTDEPTEQMSSEPTEEPETSEPMSSEPTDVSTEQMTSEVTDEPTEQMSSEPTEEPETSEPMSSEPTDVSTEQMTSEVTDEPTEQMSSEPTEEPKTSEPMSSEPTDVSTGQMSSEPTDNSTEQMTSEVTEEPTEQMSSEPTEEPETSEPMSSEPTDVSTEKMTSEITNESTKQMSSEPTDVSTEQMTSEVTEEPTEQMSSEPTEEPKTTEPISSEPTDVSTEKMTSEVTEEPTEQMSSEPTDVSTEQMTTESTDGEEKTSPATEATSSKGPASTEPIKSEAPTDISSEKPQTSEPMSTEQISSTVPTEKETTQSGTTEPTTSDPASEKSTPASSEAPTDPVTTSDGQSEPTSSPEPDSTEPRTDEKTTQQTSEEPSTNPCGDSGNCFETVSKPAPTEEPTTECMDPNSFFNTCARSCVQTCDEDCDEPGDEVCERRCDCSPGYVFHDGECIERSSCKTPCQKEYEALLETGYEDRELKLCDEEGNYLPMKCVGMDNCQCVNRDGEPAHNHTFFVSDFECDFDRGIHCIEGLEFYECGHVYDKYCDLVDNPELIPDPEECHAPKCGCPRDTPLLQGNRCVAEEDCEADFIPSFESIIDDFFTANELNITHMAPNFETCTNDHPTCEAWAARDMCDHKYLIKNCKPACDLCPLEEMRLTCQGIRDAINDHLEDNMVLGAPEVVCQEDNQDKFFPRQCSGSVCMCVNEKGQSDEDHHHHISHLYQCPGVEECPGDQLFMNCAFNLNSCDEEVDEAECSQGCGCPYNMPYYNEEEMKCQSKYQFCPPSITVVEGMDCNEIAAGAEFLGKVAPICDEMDETEYAALQCGDDGVCYCVSADGKIEEEDVGSDYVCPRTHEKCRLSGGKVYDKCGSSCPATCENMFSPPIVCTLQCVIGCACPEGKVENQDGNCVDAEDCDNFEDYLPEDCRSRAFSFNYIGREDDLSLPYHDCDDKGNYRSHQCNEDGCFCVMPFTGMKIEGTEHEMSEKDTYDCDAAVESQQTEEPTDYVTSDGSVVTEEGSGGTTSVTPKITESTETPEASTSYSETTTPVAPKNYVCLDDTSTDECACINDQGEIIPDSVRDGAFFIELAQSREIYCDFRRNMATTEDCYRKREEGADVRCRPDGKYYPVQCTEEGCVCMDEYGTALSVDDVSQEVPNDAEQAEPICLVAIAARLERSKCLQERAEGDHLTNNMMVGVFFPRCEDNGDYEPVQCRGAMCYCVNTDGEQFSNAEYGRGELGEEELLEFCNNRRYLAGSTNCSLMREEAESGDIMVGAFVPDCDVDGYFKPVQSFGSESFCYDPYHGHEIADTRHNRGEDYDCEAAVGALMEFECYMERQEIEEESMVGMVGEFYPECSADGSYFPVQCLGSVCYCVNADGEEFPNAEFDISTDRDEMIESCNRRRVLALSTKCSAMMRMIEATNPMPGSVPEPECDVDGLFMPKQSYGSESFCVDPYNGEEIPDTRHTRGDESYNCERVVTLLLSSDCYMERREADEQTQSGMVGVFTPECSVDGTYHHTQCVGSVCYCAESSTGRELEDSRRPIGGDDEYCEERRDMYEGSDCYQTMMAAKEAPGQFTPECDDFGSYKPRQTDGSRNFCVDRDGNELIETEAGVRGAEYCQELRELHDNSPCYQDQDEVEGFGTVVLCDVRTGLYQVTQTVGSNAYCADSETGEKIEGTDHHISEVGKCGTIQDPYVKCSELQDSGDEDVSCNEEDGMYMRQQCDGETQTCTCVDKWGDQLAGTSSHHVSEHGCFEEERDEIRDSFSGSECQVERDISREIEDDVYEEQCNDDGTYARRQCTGSDRLGCFCLDMDGDFQAGSMHSSDEMRECGEVVYTFSGPKGDSAMAGTSGQVMCSVFASYQDDTFEMLFGRERYESRDMDLWADVQEPERSVENYRNGTVRTTLSITLDNLSYDMNEAIFACVSQKNQGSIIRGIMVMTEPPTTPQPTTEGMTTPNDVITTEDATTTPEVTTPQATTQPPVQFVRIFNAKRGYVYAESADSVKAYQEIDDDDDNAKFERMEDNTLRSIAFDLCLAQTIESGTITIRLKECKANPTQTWLVDTDTAGDDRLYVLRPGKKGKAPTEYYLDYFKKELTGYKVTNKANQKWTLVAGDQ